MQHYMRAASCKGHCAKAGTRLAQYSQISRACRRSWKVWARCLILREAADSRSCLVQLVQETGARALLFNHLYDPISMVRDNEVKAAMLGINVYCQSFNGDVLVEPWEILSANGMPLTSFDSYWQRCLPSCEAVVTGICVCLQGPGWSLQKDSTVSASRASWCLSPACSPSIRALALCRAMNMPQPPPALLPAPKHMPAVPASLSSLSLEQSDLAREADQLSNQHLPLEVLHMLACVASWLIACSCHAPAQKVACMRPSSHPAA